jgi:hypothetical protein
VNVALCGDLAVPGSLLDQRLASFLRSLRREDLVGVMLDRDRLPVTRVKATTSEKACSLDHAIDGVLPRVHG